MISSSAIKICLNCGDKLLPDAKKCPTCGAKAKDFPVVDKGDEQQIEVLISQAIHPKDSLAPKWKKRLETKESVWTNAKMPTKREAVKARIEENKSTGVACCPKCGSTSLSANKKGFGVGKAAVGVFTVGILGAAAGGIGSGKVVVTCLNCGHRWKV